MEALDSLGLGNLASRAPMQLSGGEQQRVAIARALVINPLLLLADEPTGALDSATSKDIISIFERLNRESGRTILLVTHESTVAAYAKRVVMLRDGRVISDERPQTKKATG
jgi:putative ABC transport system ATP-binding protein